MTKLSLEQAIKNLPEFNDIYDSLPDGVIFFSCLDEEKHLVVHVTRALVMLMYKTLDIVITNDRPIYHKVKTSKNNDLYLACYEIKVPVTSKLIDYLFYGYTFSVLRDASKKMRLELDDVEELLVCIDYLQPINIKSFLYNIYLLINKYIGDNEIDISSILRKFYEMSHIYYPMLKQIMFGYHPELMNQNDTTTRIYEIYPNIHTEDTSLYYVTLNANWFLKNLDFIDFSSYGEIEKRDVKINNIEIHFELMRWDKNDILNCSIIGMTIISNKYDGCRLYVLDIDKPDITLYSCKSDQKSIGQFIFSMKDTTTKLDRSHLVLSFIMS